MVDLVKTNSKRVKIELKNNTLNGKIHKSMGINQDKNIQNEKKGKLINNSEALESMGFYPNELENFEEFEELEGFNELEKFEVEFIK